MYTEDEKEMLTASSVAKTQRKQSPEKKVLKKMSDETEIADQVNEFNSLTEKVFDYLEESRKLD